MKKIRVWDPGSMHLKCLVYLIIGKYLNLSKNGHFCSLLLVGPLSPGTSKSVYPQAVASNVQSEVSLKLLHKPAVLCSSIYREHFRLRSSLFHLVATKE